MNEIQAVIDLLSVAIDVKTSDETRKLISDKFKNASRVSLTSRESPEPRIQSRGDVAARSENIDIGRVTR